MSTRNDATASPPDLASLRAAFGGRLITDDADQAPFLLDWRRRWRGRAIAVAQPDSTQDVAALVRWCAARGVPIVAQGGNTGMSGGSVPDESGRAIVLSLARMNRIRAIDDVNNTMTVDAGCVLQSIQQAADAADRLFPLSLAAEGSCTIGGNLSTNAGGVQVIRFGNARELCLGLEVVTPAGEIWDGLRGLRKDNTGYDLRDLFIGAEGTLGVITGAVLKLFPKPRAKITAFVAVDTPARALALLSLARERLDASLTAFELISDACLGLVTKHFADARRPLDGASPWYVLLESADTREHDAAFAAIEAMLGDAIDHGIATDAAIATSLAQATQFWVLRERISEAQAAEGKNIKHDVSVPISRIAEFIESTDAAISGAHPGIRMIVFGHLGDGNLHYNVSPPPGVVDGGAAFLDAQSSINRIAHDAVVRFGGSISAEHGLGVLRRDESARYKSAVEMRMMRAIKAALDPQGLMNPGKFLPEP
ncbi:MAG: FAD-binding oxidoreductase [Lautropia sp.]